MLQATGGLVYYDLLGLYLVHYTELAGALLNLAAVGLALAVTLNKLYNSHTYGLAPIVLARQMGVAALAQVFYILYVYSK